MPCTTASSIETQRVEGKQEQTQAQAQTEGQAQTQAQAQEESRLRRCQRHV